MVEAVVPDAAVTLDPHLLQWTFNRWRQGCLWLLVMLELCFHSLQPEQDLL